MPSSASPGSSEVLAGLHHRLGTAVILITGFAASLCGFEAVFNRSAIEDVAKQPGGWLGAVIVVACSAIVHELLHALGWVVIARLPWRSVSVRRTLRVMGFIAYTGTAIPLSAFRISLMLPAVILGGGTIAVGLFSGQGLFVLWGNFFLLECYSDLTVLLATARLQAAARVREYPDRLGCQVDHG